MATKKGTLETNRAETVFRLCTGMNPNSLEPSSNRWTNPTDRSNRSEAKRQFNCPKKPFVAYCAFTHASDPVTLTATSEMKRCRGLPSAVPR
jgi:hypothetical protein